MSSIELNIIERGLKGQAWTAEKGPINAGDLSNIAEQQSSSSSALNALPTPFARFFVVKDAFRRVYEENLNSKKAAGLAYRRLVSDTLDVYELLFNMAYHQSHWGNNRRIEITEWRKQENLGHLKTTLPVLGKAIDKYFDRDIKDEMLYFIVLVDSGKDYLLATSSPYTGFVTPPDLDKKPQKHGQDEPVYMGNRYVYLPNLKRKNGGSYFKDICLFEQRDSAFKNYMYRLVDNPEMGPQMTEFRDYIKYFAADPSITTECLLEMRPIFSNNNSELVVGGLRLQQDCSVNATNWFNDVLIKLPFRMSLEHYVPMTYLNDSEDRDYDFLLPLSEEAMNTIAGDFMCSCRILRNGATVTLTYKGQTYSKEYYYTPVPSKGLIVDLKLLEQFEFNLATFPNILSPDSTENNYFKVMLVTNNGSLVDHQNVTLSFYRKKGDNHFGLLETNDPSNEHASFGVHPAVVRSTQGSSVKANSVFYEIFNCVFDAIRIEITGNEETHTGILLPRWKQSERTDTSYTFAIDLGTTNTYISCSNNKQNNEPEQLIMSEPMVAYLHDYIPSEQQAKVRLIEEAISGNLRKNFITEFAPAFIDGKVYNFPIRTALCVPAGHTSNFTLFDNCNIAFFYEKTTGLENQGFSTDIKWDDNHKQERELFIRELLLIVKAAILQKGGQLQKTKLIWFKPLSFKGETANDYYQLWNEEGRKILNINEEENIRCVSESEAPYYYFNKKSEFKSVNSVAIVDIGGGSCDFMYFADGAPQIANSVQFGCDVLWGNGSNDFANAQDNGIFAKAKDLIHFNNNAELEELNKRMTSNKLLTTKEVINFWVSNQQHCSINDLLKKYYRPLFLYHFTAIVYYMAKMYRTKHLAYPKSILFCGNGSHYIDGLLTNKAMVSEITTDIFRKVYGGALDSIQVILPGARKECTCYGGLYRPDQATKPEVYNFQGAGNTIYPDVASLKSQFGILKDGVLKALHEFNNIYDIQLTSMMQQGEFKGVPYDAILRTISAGLSDSLEKNFKNTVKRLNDKEPYNDSIFFLPIIDKVLELTKL